MDRSRRKRFELAKMHTDDLVEQTVRVFNLSKERHEMMSNLLKQVSSTLGHGPLGEQLWDVQQESVPRTARRLQDIFSSLIKVSSRHKLMFKTALENIELTIPRCTLSVKMTSSSCYTHAPGRQAQGADRAAPWRQKAADHKGRSEISAKFLATVASAGYERAVPQHRRGDRLDMLQQSLEVDQAGLWMKCMHSVLEAQVAALKIAARRVSYSVRRAAASIHPAPTPGELVVMLVDLHSRARALAELEAGVTLHEHMLIASLARLMD